MRFAGVGSVPSLFDMHSAPTSPDAPATASSELGFSFGTTPLPQNPFEQRTPPPFYFGAPPPGNLFAPAEFCFSSPQAAVANDTDAVFYSVACEGESGHHRRVVAPSVIGKLRRQYANYEDDGLQLKPYDGSAGEEAKMALQRQKQLLKLQQLICELHEAVLFLHTPSLAVTPEVDEDMRRVHDMLVHTKKERNRIIEQWCIPTMRVNLLESQ
jgi:hypothetical protein